MASWPVLGEYYLNKCPGEVATRIWPCETSSYYFFEIGLYERCTPEKSSDILTAGMASCYIMIDT